jgi:Putative Actinobacterial Holin-X, holin superfamily III
MRLAVSDGMENSASDVQQASFAELLRQVVHDGQTFLRAETELLKVEAKTTLKDAALFLVLIMGSSLLLAIALSLIAAAIVVAAHGSAAAALLTAAGVDLVVSASALTFMLMKVRQLSQKAAKVAPQITTAPQHGSEVS